MNPVSCETADLQKTSIVVINQIQNCQEQTVFKQNICFQKLLKMFSES